MYLSITGDTKSGPIVSHFVGLVQDCDISSALLSYLFVQLYLTLAPSNTGFVVFVFF